MNKARLGETPPPARAPRRSGGQRTTRRQRKPTSEAGSASGIGPGLRKATTLPLLASRTLRLLQTSDYRIRPMFEEADVMSEGAVRPERQGRVYYGTTSIVLPLASCGGHVPDEQASIVFSVLRLSPHARVRAIRIACREAMVRAKGPLGTLRAELRFSHSARGLQIDVDVEAPALQEPNVPANTTTQRG